MVTALVVVAAIGILTWGFVRAKQYGKLGVLAWWQSVVLMTPWLLFFALFTAGIYLNLAGVLFLFLLSTGLYVFLGKRLRAMGRGVAQTTSASENQAPESTQAEAKDAQLEKTVATSNSTAVEEVIPIPEEDLKLVQGIFGIDTFFTTETIPYQQGVVFKGNLRGEPEAVYARLSSSLQQRLADRYRLFLVESQDNKPVVIVLPSSSDPTPSTPFQKLFAGVLFLATIATCLETAGLMLGFDLSSSFDRYRDALPISLGLLSILVAHEMGHWVLARRHQIQLSLPYFIPTWQIGSFGALTRFECILPNRAILFDIAFAGPAIGGLVAFVMLLLGLVLSHEGSLFQVPSDFFQSSILVGTLARVILGPELQKSIVDVHPLTIIGWLGLVITALNLMPAGQLDGGRIVQAIYGRKIARRTTIATLIVLAIAALVNPLALYWAVIILVLQRDLERPSFNELIEPDDARAAFALLALFLMIATLLPLAPSLAGRLGIGG